MRKSGPIGAFVVLLSLGYCGVAQVLPQLEGHPPPVVEVGADIGPEELSVAGREVFASSCSQCHSLGTSGRCPDLSRVGADAPARAAERSARTGEPYTDVDFLVESLCRPTAEVAEGVAPIMPPQGRLLDGGRLLAVVAFLQDQGGRATVRGTDLEPLRRFGCTDDEGVASSGAPAPVPVGGPQEVFTAFGCAGCHALDRPDRGVGPSLWDVGARLDRGQLYEAILDPDATLVEADPPYAAGLMRQTLDGLGFYDRMTSSDYRALVEWLAARRGEDAP